MRYTNTAFKRPVFCHMSYVPGQGLELASNPRVLQFALLKPPHAPLFQAIMWVRVPLSITHPNHQPPQQSTAHSRSRRRSGESRALTLTVIPVSATFKQLVRLEWAESCACHRPHSHNNPRYSLINTLCH